MRLLLDTHALIWWVMNDGALSRRAYEAMATDGNEIFVSAVSAMEVTTKFRIGKLPQAELLARNFAAEVEEEGFEALPITLEHATLAGSLLIPHKDPFDRLLIAQAQIEGMTLVSNEAVFDGFGVLRLW